MGKDVEGSNSGIACGFIAALFEGHPKFKKTLQDSPGRDSNPTPLEYELEAFPLEAVS
jgi:hypothetical protein